MNKDQSIYSKDKVESTLTEFKESLLMFTKRDHIKYENLIHVVSTLINDEHIFYAVIEEIFTESMLEWQKSKHMASQLRIIKLTEIITSICKLKSQNHINGTCCQDTVIELFLDLFRYD